MAESYPAVIQFDGNARQWTFEDGMELTVQEGTFDTPFECTISKVDGATVNGKSPMTSAYTFAEFTDPSTGASLDTRPMPSKAIVARVPKLVQTTVATAFEIHTNPREIPLNDDWTPDPGTGIEVGNDGKLKTPLKELKTFQVNG